MLFYPIYRKKETRFTGTGTHDPAILPLMHPIPTISSAYLANRSEASHGHTGIMSSTINCGRLCSPSHQEGGVSMLPTCLDVLIQLVNEGIQLLAVLRLQLQSITGMDPLAQGAGDPRQPQLERRMPSSQGSPPPGKLNPFLSPG